jgi:hypothetical protein
VSSICHVPEAIPPTGGGSRRPSCTRSSSSRVYTES